MQTIVDFEAFSNKSIEHSKTKGAQSERTSASAHICHLYARTRFWTSVLHWKFWTEIVRTINRNINRKIQFIHRCILRNLIWADAIRRARTCIYIVLRLETLIRQSCANFHFNHRFNCTRRSSCAMLQQLQLTWRYRPEAVVPCAFDDEKTACFHLKKGFEKICNWITRHAAPMKILIIASANAFPRNSAGSQLSQRYSLYIFFMLNLSNIRARYRGVCNNNNAKSGKDIYTQRE